MEPELAWLALQIYILRLSNKKFKGQSSLGYVLQSEIKMIQKRQDFKNICNWKIREILYNDDDLDLITKNCRLPETNSFFRNKPFKKAELFNIIFKNRFLAHPIIISMVCLMAKSPFISCVL